MFFRVKSAGSYQYLQIVHSVRQGEKVRQQVFGTLGRLDELKASGRLEALIRSGVRHCERFALIDAHAAGETQAVTVLRIGPDLVFGRLWKECGIHEVIRSLLEARRYDFDVERGRLSHRVASAFCQWQRSSRGTLALKLISFREPKRLSSVTSTEPWHSWATRLNQRAKRPWVQRAA
jgi:hypothetical protein